jgi:hypothetical protein
MPIYDRVRSEIAAPQCVHDGHQHALYSSGRISVIWLLEEGTSLYLQCGKSGSYQDRTICFASAVVFSQIEFALACMESAQTCSPRQDDHHIRSTSVSSDLASLKLDNTLGT